MINVWIFFCIFCAYRLARTCSAVCVTGLVAARSFFFLPVLGVFLRRRVVIVVESTTGTVYLSMKLHCGIVRTDILCARLYSLNVPCALEYWRRLLMNNWVTIYGMNSFNCDVTVFG